jgi:predicted membrane-bound spermidine synthase
VISTARVLLASFFLGITSLLMELSLLREFSYVMGATAVANSFVISVFLVGLAVGAWAGHGLVNRFAQRPWLAYLLVQALNVVLMLVFVSTKNWFVYATQSEPLEFVYFGVFSLTPALASGASFSLFVAALFEHGRRFIAHIYSVSTLGNVVGGLAHGLVFVPYFGMRVTYEAAVLSALVSILLMVRSRRVAAAVTASAILPFVVIPKHTWLAPWNGAIVFEKDDPSGVVLGVEVSDARDSVQPRQVAIFIGGLDDYNCSTHHLDREWKEICARTSMGLFGRPGPRALVLGFCSGETVKTIVRDDPAATVDVVEMNPAVFDMARAVFPENYAELTQHPRVKIIQSEFRNLLRFMPADRKYDLVILDVTVHEPQRKGMFTREFFRAIREHLTDDGVLFSMFAAYAMTSQEWFPYGYKHLDPSRNPNQFIQRFYTTTHVDERRLAALGLVETRPDPAPVYDDYGPAK